MYTNELKIKFIKLKLNYINSNFLQGWLWFKLWKSVCSLKFA